MTWSDAKNNRRCDLIDREVDGTITLEEETELTNLQRQLRAYRHRVAPLELPPNERVTMSEKTEVEQDAEEAIGEQTVSPLTCTITLRPTIDGYRMNLTKPQLATLEKAAVILGAIARHATDTTKELAEGCDEEIFQILTLYAEES